MPIQSMGSSDILCLERDQTSFSHRAMEASIICVVMVEVWMFSRRDEAILSPDFDVESVPRHGVDAQRAVPVSQPLRCETFVSFLPPLLALPCLQSICLFHQPFLNVYQVTVMKGWVRVCVSDLWMVWVKSCGVRVVENKCLHKVST